MLNNKVIVVTGGLGLLGKEFVKTILKENGKVIIADLDNYSSEKFINELNNEYKFSNFLFHHLDILDEKSIDELIYNVNLKFGKIDAWVNNAYPKVKSLSNKKREFSKSFFDINLSDLT